MTCSYLRVACETTNGCLIGGDGLGKRGIESFAVGSSAGKKIADVLSVGACVDSHVQVIMFVLFF